MTETGEPRSHGYDRAKQKTGHRGDTLPSGWTGVPRLRRCHRALRGAFPAWRLGRARRGDRVFDRQGCRFWCAFLPPRGRIRRNGWPQTLPRGFGRLFLAPRGRRGCGHRPGPAGRPRESGAQVFLDVCDRSRARADGARFVHRVFRSVSSHDLLHRWRSGCGHLDRLQVPRLDSRKADVPSSNPPSYRTGDAVGVLYDPDHPRDARIDRGRWNKAVPILIGGSGVFLCLLGLWILKRRPPATSRTPS